MLNQFQHLFNNRLEPQMKTHLQRVYGSVATATVVASAGAAAHVFGFFEGGLLSGVGSLIFMMMLAFSPDYEGKDGKRFAYLNGLALCTGLSTGPLIELVADIDPSIVVSALLYTFVIFTCFSFCALFARDGKFLFLGGPLLSVMSTMLLTSILNSLLFRSAFLAYVHIVLGVLVMSAFILYDTHLVMEKARRGDRDYVWHSVMLFVDLVSLFKHILVLLADKEQSNRNRNKKSNNR